MVSSVRHIAHKLLQLPESDQVDMIRSLDLREADDADLLDYEAALAAVKRASQRGSLATLEYALDKWHYAHK
ncbi:hypothetical protein G6L37_06100 [Agrobacterium rubi]|nr:hypothetical protein [Agrobacterium rubi]NTF24933.1 hypothetical protein [Agrobacterium rubi]